MTAVPGTSLFFTGSKDGDVKLWDVSKATMLGQWHKVHDRHTFLQHNARGFGAFVQVHYVVHVCAYVCVCVCLSLSLKVLILSLLTTMEASTCFVIRGTFSPILAFVISYQNLFSDDAYLIIRFDQISESFLELPYFRAPMAREGLGFIHGL